MRVIVQIGYMKSGGRKRLGQLVRAYVNDEELSWNSSEWNGKYITSRAEQNKGMLWYLCDIDLCEDDTLMLDVRTSIAGVGPDEHKTFEALYHVCGSAPIKEVNVPGVGAKGYPIVKGRIVELGEVSEADKRKSELDEFLDGGF
jgi:ferredoxin-NADP reductase